jgi:hypothetical protein
MRRSCARSTILLAAFEHGDGSELIGRAQSKAEIRCPVAGMDRRAALARGPDPPAASRDDSAFDAARSKGAIRAAACRRRGRALARRDAQKALGDRGVAGARQNRGLQRERDAFDQRRPARLLLVAVVEFARDRRRLPRRARRRRRARKQVGEQRLARRRLACSARSTSRHWTLPLPSQIELSGACRYSRGSDVPRRSRCRPGIPAPR